jgi:dienelactone hydrolase
MKNRAFNSGSNKQRPDNLKHNILIMNQLLEKTTAIIQLGKIELEADIAVPSQAHALVLFAHGSGSGRLSPRNQMVAAFLNQQGIATCLFDLLTFQEDIEKINRFNIELLATRLEDVTHWFLTQEKYHGFRIGYFGASTGAAAALKAARNVKQIAAVVSRGGRPDLVMNDLPFVKAPTLLVVGHLDTDVVNLNRKAFDQLHCEKKMEIIPGAGHLFEERGTMEKVCVMAAAWLEAHLQPLELYN